MPTDSNPVTINLDALADLAGKVAVVQSDLDAATQAERQATLDLLTAVLAKAKPGLPAICSRPVLAESSGNDALKSWNGGDSKTRAAWRGICIAGDDEEVREGRRDDNRGPIAGCGLWLRPDLSLAELAYDGSWSRWQGEGSAWSATVTEYSDLAAAIAAGWNKLDPEDVAKVLADAMTAVLAGKASDRAKAMRERAGKLSAIAALL
jgi:hypothetical protein